MQPNRTWLFAPGNHPRKVEKVFGTGADVAILDLEDAVAVAKKEAARGPVAAALALPRSCRAYVRVNALDTGYTFGDLEAVAGPGLDGIVLPKVERAADIQMVDWVIGSLERKNGLAPGSIDLMPILESGRGIAGARQICGAAGRLKRVSFGAGDYTRDMGMEWTMTEHEIDAARAEVVLASRINDLEPPVDTVFIHIREHDAFRASCIRVRQSGFQGKLCIHPDQVGLANAAFTPTEQEVSWARKIVAAFREAEAAGSASIQVDGYFIDYPIVEKAERMVALAETVAGSGQ
ncbi:MAG TPA: CoA ester lyase [Thermohalobaculum sp.]|nr:CoA ester lyase [Thermohalobaculum sp.]